MNAGITILDTLLMYWSFFWAEDLRSVALTLSFDLLTSDVARLAAMSGNTAQNHSRFFALLA